MAEIMQSDAKIAGVSKVTPPMMISAQDVKEVTLQLNWFPLADHSPIYLARERGYYEAEGINLEIVRGQGSGDAAQKIDLGRAEFGISDTPTVLTAISKDADIIVVGMVYDKAANNLFYRKSDGIKSPKDLVGKKIAAPPGDSHRFLWPSFSPFIFTKNSSRCHRQFE
jgi:NitT/TauT family transport system substrate-binding protein